MTVRALHFDIPIDDEERAVAFYRAAFGWELRRWGAAPYWNVADDPDARSGIAGALVPPTESGHGLGIYLGVEDLDAVLDRVRGAGGSVVSEPAEIPGVGRVAQIRDPEGNVVGLLEPRPMIPTAG